MLSTFKQHKHIAEDQAARNGEADSEVERAKDEGDGGAEQVRLRDVRSLQGRVALNVVQLKS